MKINILLILLCCMIFTPAPPQSVNNRLTKPLPVKKYSASYFKWLNQRIEDSLASMDRRNDLEIEQVRQRTDSLIAYYKKRFYYKQKTQVP